MSFIQALLGALLRTDLLITGTIASIVLFRLIGCSHDSGDSEPLPDILSESEVGGFADLVFRVSGDALLPDGSRRLVIRATHHGTPVGLAILIDAKWRESQLGPSIPVHVGGLQYESIGPESDAFLAAMGEFYAVPGVVSPMAKKVQFSVISLEGDPGQLDRGTVKMKLFIESKDESRYAELYTNIDLARRKAWILEKDPEYRKPILRAMAGS